MKMQIKRIGRATRDGWECNEYEVVIKNKGCNKDCEYTTSFYTGTGWTEDPTELDVIESLLLDMRSGDMNFEEFCNEFCNDPDSLRARKTHRACQRTSAAMRRVFSQEELDELEAQVEKRNE